MTYSAVKFSTKKNNVGAKVFRHTIQSLTVSVGV